MSDSTGEQRISQLQEENEILRDEVRVARRASDITAQLVAEQFTRLEEVLMKLEEKAQAEQRLGRELARRLSEAKKREGELARERQQLEDIQIASINMMEDIAAAQRAAEAAAKAKSEFLANMSHEIRTPMTAILGYADILRQGDERSEASPEQSRAIETIHRNGQHLLAVINDILDLSKFEAGKMTIERLESSPFEIVTEVCELMRMRAEDKELTLESEVVGLVPTAIQTDPTRLRQVLVNLVGNAIKFTESGGVRLVMRMHGAPDSDNPSLQFEVIDTGIGMTQAQVDELFRPFTQGDSSTTRQFGGTGLGLTISKRFAELLGGNITVTSQQGKGTTFTLLVSTGNLKGIEFRRTMPDPLSRQSRKVDPEPAGGPAALQGARILLAEDGPDNQRLITFHLGKAGANVTLADNGRIACVKATEAWQAGKPFDVILMDMQMPVMDGYAATRQLRDEGYRGPIIALTAHAMAGDRDRCISVGCDDYATKPIDRNSLIEAIRRQWKTGVAAFREAPG